MLPPVTGTQGKSGTEVLRGFMVYLVPYPLPVSFSKAFFYSPLLNIFGTLVEARIILNVQPLDAFKEERTKDSFLSFLKDVHMCDFHMHFAQGYH